jgi:hypothetical protein
VPLAPPSVVAQAAAESAFPAERWEALKAAISQSNRMLAAMIEPVSRLEIEGSEMRLYFPAESRTIAEMVQARDPMEKLRTIASQVLGQPLRVCVRLEAATASTAAPPAPRGGADQKRKAEQDPMVREMLARFGGQISNVRPRNED